MLYLLKKLTFPLLSKAEGEYNGQKLALLCGRYSYRYANGLPKFWHPKKDLKGTVKFIFQPAEEGAPDGEEGGAELMVKGSIKQS
jgi:amidohydrolase